MGLSFRRRRRGNVGGVETVPILVPSTAIAAIATGVGEEDPRSIPSAGLPEWVLTTPHNRSKKDDVTSSDVTPDTITMMTSIGGVRGGGTTTSNTLPHSPLVKNNATALSENVNNNMASSSSSSSPVTALFPGTGGTGELPRLRKARGGNNSSSAITTNTQTKNVVGKNVSVKNDNNSNSNKDTMRRIKSIKKGFYLTPPKKDTPNIHPTTTHLRKVESTSPTSVKSVYKSSSSNYWNGNDVDISSTFELMYKQNNNKHHAAVNGGRVQNCSSGSGSSSPSSGDWHANEQQSLLLLDKSFSTYKQHGLSGACTLSTVATSVTNYQPSTVVTTSSSSITTNNNHQQKQQQQQQQPPQRQEQSLSTSSPRLTHQNLSSLFERSMEEDDDDDDANDDTFIGIIQDTSRDGGNGNDANNIGADAVVPLSDYSSLNSKTLSEEQQQQQFETNNNTGGVLSLLKRRSSIVDGAAAGAYIKNKVLVGGVTHPSPPPPPKNIIITKTNPSSLPVVLDIPSSVPKFINRSASDDISKASTLTEPDYFRSTTNRQVPTTKPLRGTNTATTTTTNTTTNTRSTPPKNITSTTDDVDGITTSIVTSVIDDGQHGVILAMLGSAGTMMGADRLWDSVQHAFNVLDTMCSPACSNISNGEKDMTNRCNSMHLEGEDKFTPAFQNEIIKTGIRLIYHELSPSVTTTDSTNWVKSSVTLFLHPGGNSTHLRQPILVWATLPIILQMKMAMCAFDDNGSNIEDDWKRLSLMDVHSILGDEGDHEGGCVRAASSSAGAPSSSFFSITSSNGSVYVFEAPSSEARDYIVRGLRLVIARLTYDIIMGDSKIISDPLNSGDEDDAAAAVDAKTELG